MAYHLSTITLDHLIQNTFRPLFKFWPTKSIFQNFLAKRPPEWQEGRELDNFTRFISRQLWFDLIYSPPISNWPWHHPVGGLQSVSLWVNSTFSPPIFRLPWIHPVTLQFLKLYPNITPYQKSTAWSFFFVRRSLIFYLKNILFVSTNFFIPVSGLGNMTKLWGSGVTSSVRDWYSLRLCS